MSWGPGQYADYILKLKAEIKEKQVRWIVFLPVGGNAAAPESRVVGIWKVVFLI